MEERKKPTQGKKKLDGIITVINVETFRDLRQWQYREFPANASQGLAFRKFINKYFVSSRQSFSKIKFMYWHTISLNGC